MDGLEVGAQLVHGRVREGRRSRELGLVAEATVQQHVELDSIDQPLRDGLDLVGESVLVMLLRALVQQLVANGVVLDDAQPRDMRARHSRLQDPILSSTRGDDTTPRSTSQYMINS